MPYTIKYQEEISCILVNVEGKLDLPTFKGMAADVAQIVQAHGCTRILNDLRKARPTEGALEIFNMPKTATFFGSLFVMSFPPGAPAWFYLLTILMVFTASTIWYGMMAYLFS